MEVDEPPSSNMDGKGESSMQAQEKIIKIHPLSIIGISDHWTRVVSGGSALASNSIIMGILFGYQKGLTISIIDAEEVEYKKDGEDQVQHEHVKTKIELHQKVFPMHEVVGWYRVSTTTEGGEDDDEGMMGLPTTEDMMINNGWMKEYSKNPLFILMNTLQEEEEEEEADEMKERGEPTEGAQEKLDRDEELPLSIYETLVTSDGKDQTRSVFLNLEFELETFESERIAVEKVFKTQPTAAVIETLPSSTDERGQQEEKSNLPMAMSNPEKKTKRENEEDDAPQPTPPLSASALHIQSLKSSIEAMNARIAVLLEFLKKTQSGQIPLDHGILRQVESLIRQLPFVMGRGDFTTRVDAAACNNQQMKDTRLVKEFESECDDMLLMSFLASVAKTTKTVLTYSEKFRVANDTSHNRDGMGGMRKPL